MIVDASVAVKWLIVEEASDSARLLLDRSDLLAPTLLHVEVANVIWKKRQRGQFEEDAELIGLPGKLASLVQTIDETPMMDRALEIAFELGHPAYDCVYLAVAEAFDDRLVTADARLLRRLGDTAYAGLAVPLG